MLLVCGYPKTGNTWFQVIISYIVHPKESIAGTASDLSNIFTHAMPSYNQVSYKQQKIVIEDIETARCVLLIRHPGDVLVSLYMHNHYREHKSLYNGTIDQMVYDPIYGIKKYIKFYQWWANNLEKTESYCIIRYEDMLKNTYKEVCRMLNIFKVIVHPQHIQNAIEFGSFQNMKQMEQTDHLKKWSSMKPSHNASINAMKVREGQSGNYIKIFQQSTIDYIHQHLNNLPSIYHY